MLKFVKALHIIGVAMFFGSVLGHIAGGFVPGVQEDPQAALVARQTISVATIYLTLPGLAVLLLTGSFMIVKGKLPISRLRWLALHVTFGVLIALNAAVFLYPTGLEALALAAQAAAGDVSMDLLHGLEGRERTFGAVNVLLTLAALFLAVIRPRLRTTRSA